MDKYTVVSPRVGKVGAPFVPKDDDEAGYLLMGGFIKKNSTKSTAPRAITKDDNAEVSADSED